MMGEKSIMASFSKELAGILVRKEGLSKNALIHFEDDQISKCIPKTRGKCWKRGKVSYKLRIRAIKVKWQSVQMHVFCLSGTVGRNQS